MRHRTRLGAFLAMATLVGQVPVSAQEGEAEDERVRLAMARLALYENSPLLDRDLGNLDNLLGDLLSLTRKSLARSRIEGGLEGRSLEVSEALLEGRHESTSELADDLVSRGISQDVLLRVRSTRVPEMLSDHFEGLETWAQVASVLSRTPLVLTQEAKNLPAEFTAMGGISLPNLTLERSLQILLAGRGLTYRVRNKIVIDAPDRLPTSLSQVYDLAVRAMRVLPDLATPVRESTALLEQLADHHDARIAEGAATALEQIRASRTRAAPGTPPARFALARLALYENSSVLDGMVEPGHAALQDLFRETREILHHVRSEGLLEPPIERSIVDILLEGRDAAISWAHEYGGRPPDEPDDLQSLLVRPRRVHITTKGLPVDQVVGIFSRTTGIPIAVSTEVEKLPAERKTLVTKQASNAREYLQFIGDTTGMTYELLPDVLVMVLPDREPETAAKILDLAREAITVLGLLGPRAGEAVPVLETLSTSSDAQIAQRARAALRQIRQRPYP